MQPDQESNSSDTSNVSEGLCRRFSLDEMVAATDNFNDSFAIGQGGFAKVYIGQINNGALTVAIKKSKFMSPELRREFRDEILMVTRFRHNHLVSLIGYCETDNETILVYEYMAGGTLEANLHKSSLNENNSNIVPLCWVERLKICIGAARGLDYLHTGTATYQKVIHRDVKSANILLDEARITAKIADFGLSKIGPANQADTRVMTRVVGTFGYLDPDYYTTGMLTSKSDVYAFGVVLFELLCGRPAVDGTLDEDQRGLAGWARLCVKKRKVRQIIDPILKFEILPSSLSVYVKVADKCLQSHPKYRPTMTEVLAELVLALSLQENGKRNINKSATGSMTEKFMLLFSPTPRPRILDNSPVFDATTAAPNDMEGALNDTQAVPNDTEDTPNKTRAGPSDFQSVNNVLVDVPYIQPRELKKITNNFSANDIIDNSAVFDATTAAPNDMEGALNDIQAVPNDTEDTPNKTRAGPSDFQSLNNVLVDIPYIQPEEFKKITNFSANDIIGEGTYIKAYSILKGGEASCIKKYNFPIPPIDNFLTLVTGLSRLKHENLVKALGYCADENFCILAYEYAPMGSLHDILHRQKGAYPVPVLSWLERVKIAYGAAKGLEYLHEKAQPNVVHRAIKSSNVLLFNDGVVKIADIKLFDHKLDMEWHDSGHPYVMPLTSVAPEYIKTGQFNSKCDVYSFGVVLLELLTGCKYRDTTLPRGQQNLVTWIHTLSKASPRLSEDEVKQCIDRRLKGKYPPEAAAKMAEIAAMCVKYKARSRPKMSIVVKALETLVKAVPGPSSEPPQHL